MYINNSGRKSFLLQIMRYICSFWSVSSYAFSWVPNYTSPSVFPVVVFTSSNKVQDLASSYNLGANSFVRKPVIFEEFISVLGKIIDYWLEVNITAETNY